MRLVLASGSPRRRELLCRLHVPFAVQVGDVAERAPRPGEAPIEYALQMARDKARGAQRHDDETVVLTADTVVAVDGQILGKPRDEADALRMLRLLSARTHTVVTAVMVAGPAGSSSQFRASSVTMRAIPDAEARRYIAGGEPMDKAGAYAVQGLGGAFVLSVTGCFNAVVGLPLCCVEPMLTAAGIVVPVSGPLACGHPDAS